MSFGFLYFLFLNRGLGPMDSKSVVDLIEASSGVHFSGFHMNGLQRHSEVDQPSATATERMHSQPFVIGIVGFWS